MFSISHHTSRADTQYCYQQTALPYRGTKPCFTQEERDDTDKKLGLSTEKNTGDVRTGKRVQTQRLFAALAARRSPRIVCIDARTCSRRTRRPISLTSHTGCSSWMVWSTQPSWAAESTPSGSHPLPRARTDTISLNMDSTLKFSLLQGTQRVP